MSAREGNPAWGATHTLAAGITAIGLDVVHRGTLRALLPEGETKLRGRAGRNPQGRNLAAVRRVNGLDAQSKHLIELGQMVGYARNETSGKSRNRMSERFKKALNYLEDRGWIARGTKFVMVRDRIALADHATTADPPAGWALDLARSIEAIRVDLENPSDAGVRELEHRRQELLAIQRLMEQGFGTHNWSGRGSVRFLPRSRTI